MISIIYRLTELFRYVINGWIHNQTRVQMLKEQFYGLQVNMITTVTEETVDYEKDSYYRPSTFRSNTLLSVENVKENYPPDVAISVKPTINDYYFVVYVTYSTGDSYGTDHGFAELLAAFDNEDDAKELQNTIKLDYKKWKSTPYHSYEPFENLIRFNGYDIPSNTWKDYFGGLEDVSIARLQCL